MLDANAQQQHIEKREALPVLLLDLTALLFNSPVHSTRLPLCWLWAIAKDASHVCESLREVSG